MLAAAMANIQLKKIICNISPRAIASTIFVGMMLTNICTWSISPFAAALFAISTALPVAVKLTPTPGSNTLTTNKPTNNAKVVAISNHKIALPPNRPNFLKSPVPAIPITRELKINGTTIILIMRINTSPNGFSCFAKSGAATPTNTPAIRPITIHPDRPNLFNTAIESPFFQSNTLTWTI